MIVLPTYHDGGTMIDEAVDAAARHMPDEPLLVVDSASPDRTYMERIDADIADVGNVNYATGAYRWVYENRPADFYYLFQDSLIIEADLTHLRERDVTAVRWFPMPHTGWGFDDRHERLCVWGSTAYDGTWPEDYAGVFGPMLACTHDVLGKILRLVTGRSVTKFHECAMERLWGMALAEEGYDVTDGALQGKMDGYFGTYPDSQVRKILADRP